jgi:hypothetical protein
MGKTALFTAAQRGDSAWLQMLLDSGGFDVNAVDHFSGNVCGREKSERERERC